MTVPASSPARVSRSGSASLGFFALAVGAIALRFAPHWPNFTAVGAMVLFCGAWMAIKQLWFPLAAIVASDFVLTGLLYHAAPTVDQYFTWAGWGIFLALGLSLRHRVRPTRTALTTIGGSAAFFLISNFGVWFSGLLYPHTLSGLAACYTAGLPFAANELLGDLFFAALFFGVYAWVRQRQAAPATMAPAGR
ncbi:MAG: DUF6580 family putative transport protein [Terriglobales bacterium]